MNNLNMKVDTSQELLNIMRVLMCNYAYMDANGIWYICRSSSKPRFAGGVWTRTSTHDASKISIPANLSPKFHGKPEDSLFSISECV